MPTSKAQQRAVSKYMKNNYDVFQIRMPKGKKDTLKVEADRQGKSLNVYVKKAIENQYLADTGEKIDL